MKQQESQLVKKKKKQIVGNSVSAISEVVHNLNDKRKRIVEPLRRSPRMLEKPMGSKTGAKVKTKQKLQVQSVLKGTSSSAQGNNINLASSQQSVTGILGKQ